MISESVRYFLGLFRGRRIPPKGTKVGKETWISPSVYLDPIAGGRLITIGDYVKISSDVKILVHDASSASRIGAIWVAPVEIGDRSFIGAGAIILPGVKIGTDTVIAAGAVVANNVPDGSIFAGIPARNIGTIRDLDEKRMGDMKLRKCFSRAIYYRPNLKEEQMQEMTKIAKDQGGFFFIDDT